MKPTGLPILMLILIFGCVACVPIPHRYQYDPNIEGEIQVSGMNTSPISVALFRCATWLDECVNEQKLDTSPIENSGAFRLTGTRKFAAYAVVMAHCDWRWNVEFYDSESSVMGAYHFGRYGPCVAPEVVKVKCTLPLEGEVLCESSGI